MTHAGYMPDAGEAPALSETDCEALAAWVDSVIRQNGGRIMGANLGSALSNANRTMYRKIKCRWLCVCALACVFARAILRVDLSARCSLVLVCL